MKIEIGKYYKTREGRKIFIGGVYMAEGGRVDRYVGYFINHQGDYCPENWYPEGLFTYAGGLHPLDLVCEWTEPTELKPVELPEKLTLGNGSYSDVDLWFQDRINKIIDYCQFLAAQINNLTTKENI